MANVNFRQKLDTLSEKYVWLKNRINIIVHAWTFPRFKAPEKASSKNRMAVISMFKPQNLLYRVMWRCQMALCLCDNIAKSHWISNFSVILKRVQSGVFKFIFPSSNEKRFYSTLQVATTLMIMQTLKSDVGKFSLLCI